MTKTHPYNQPWLHSAWFDGVFILLPAILALCATALLPDKYKYTGEMPVWAWVVLVMLIDVAHVYSTLFRTYLHKQRFARHRLLYWAVPIGCYVVGTVLYSVDSLVFWRVLAYLAVFHFIRQQYGFMRLYSRFEPRGDLFGWIDALAIYAATLYPLIYWHLTPGRNFNWFVEGDFVQGESKWVVFFAQYLYFAILLLFVGKEVILLARNRVTNLPKVLTIGSTFLSWYVGVVYFNGDMTFTLLNVVAHGIPYMSLVWLFRRKDEQSERQILRGSGKLTLVFFVVSVIIFAYLEEGLWDGFVWRERSYLFAFFYQLPAVKSKELLALLVPLLSLPQSTHYVLDGFIWRRGH